MSVKTTYLATFSVGAVEVAVLIVLARRIAAAPIVRMANVDRAIVPVVARVTGPVLAKVIGSLPERNGDIGEQCKTKWKHGY